MYGAGRDDDGLSPLDAERYLQIRIADQLAYYHGRIRSAASAGAGTLQFLAIAAGASGAILAAAGLDVWIGLTSGAAAALLAYLGSLQVDNTIVTYNQSATKLAGIERDWRARSPAQPTPQHSTDLVTRGETVLTSELTGWVQQMSDTMHELKNKQASMANQIEPEGLWSRLSLNQRPKQAPAFRPPDHRAPRGTRQVMTDLRHRKPGLICTFSEHLLHLDLGRLPQPPGTTPCPCETRRTPPDRDEPITSRMN